MYYLFNSKFNVLKNIIFTKKNKFNIYIEFLLLIT